MYKRSQLGIGYLAQEASIFRGMSVEDNLFSVLEMTNLSREEQNQKCEDLLSEFGLTKIRKNKGVFIIRRRKKKNRNARCLATNPSFILLDEPFAGVDPIAVEDIQKLYRN